MHMDNTASTINESLGLHSEMDYPSSSSQPAAATFSSTSTPNGVPDIAFLATKSRFRSPKRSGIAMKGNDEEELGSSDTDSSSSSSSSEISSTDQEDQLDEDQDDDNTVEPEGDKEEGNLGFGLKAANWTARGSTRGSDSMSTGRDHESVSVRNHDERPRLRTTQSNSDSHHESASSVSSKYHRASSRPHSSQSYFRNNNVETPDATATTTTPGSTALKTTALACTQPVLPQLHSDRLYGVFRDRERRYMRGRERELEDGSGVRLELERRSGRGKEGEWEKEYGYGCTRERVRKRKRREMDEAEEIGKERGRQLQRHPQLHFQQGRDRADVDMDMVDHDLRQLSVETTRNSRSYPPPPPIQCTSRSTQTSPVRVEPIHSTLPRTYVKILMPSSRYREEIRYSKSQLQSQSQSQSGSQVQTEIESSKKSKSQYEYRPRTRIPSPPPSLSAPLVLRLAPDMETEKVPGFGHDRDVLASNGYYGSRYPRLIKTPSISVSNTGQGSKPPTQAIGHRRDDNGNGNNDGYDDEYDMDEDEVQVSSDYDDGYRPLPKGHIVGGNGNARLRPHPNPNVLPLVVGSTSTMTTTTSTPSSYGQGKNRHQVGVNGNLVHLSNIGPGLSAGIFTLGSGAYPLEDNNGVTSRMNMFHVGSSNARVAAASNSNSNGLQSPFTGTIDSNRDLRHSDTHHTHHTHTHTYTHTFPNALPTLPTIKKGGKTRYQCLYCPSPPDDFSRKNDAYRHMSRKHFEEFSEWIYCGRGFDFRGGGWDGDGLENGHGHGEGMGMGMGMSRSGPIPSRNTQRRREGKWRMEFICQFCGRVLSRGDALTRHLRSCKGVKESGSSSTTSGTGTGTAAVGGTAVGSFQTMTLKRGKGRWKTTGLGPGISGNVDHEGSGGGMLTMAGPRRNQDRDPSLVDDDVDVESEEVEDVLMGVEGLD